MIRKVNLVLLLCALFLAACASPPAAAPEATAVLVTPLPTDTAVPPTATNPPTPTPLPPTETPLPEPTATPEPPSPTLAEQMEAFMNEEAEADRFSGVALVARGDEILFEQAYGLADRVEEIPNTVTTRFRIGLLTRAFTAMAILQLQEQGLLDVNDSVCEYMADCPESWQPITIHHLLSHSSGILDQSIFAEDSTSSPLPMEPVEVVDQVRNRMLSFEPGAEWGNSNVDYFLLGMIIEQVSGQPYEQFLQENIFDPLGMADTGYAQRPDNLAKGYYRFWSLGSLDIGRSFAYEGLYSTAEDLHRWAQALQTGHPFSDELLELMFTPYVSRADDLGEAGAFGYGWSYHVLNDRPAWGCCERGHYGYVYDLQMFPEDGVIAIVLSNREDHEVGRLSDTMTAWVLDEQ